MTGPRLMIVIGDVLHEPWHSISTQGQIPTWLATAERPGVVVRHSHGKKLSGVGRFADRWHERLRWSTHGRPRVPAIDAFFGKPFLKVVPTVRVTTWADSGQVAWAQDLPDMYVAQRWKVLGSLTQALTEDWDFIYFTTASSYVRVDALVEAVSVLPRREVYAGTVMRDWPSGMEFASGASRLFSRDTAELVLRERMNYRNDVMEDAGIGRILAGHGIELLPWYSINIDSLESLRGLSVDELLQSFHYRLTSGSLDDRRDIELMHALHNRLASIMGT